MPTRATDGSSGYDLYSAIHTTITPGERTRVPTDISLTPPPGTYAQIQSRSGLSANHGIDTTAGVIDPDYTGNVTVILHNTGTIPYTIQTGDRIAQLIYTRIETPTLTETAELTHTNRGQSGFGSTDEQTHPAPSCPTDPITRTLTEQLTEHDIVPSPQNKPTDNTIQPPINIYMSDNPFDDLVNIKITIKGDHPTLGMILHQCPHRHKLQVTDMAKGTPACRIPKWRSILRHAYLLQLDKHIINSMDDLLKTIQQARKHRLLTAECKFATDKSYGIHPQMGIPQIYFDQMNIIARHIHDANTDHKTNQGVTRTLNHDPTPNNPTESQQKAFTLSQLRKREDWPDWQNSRYKQLDQYMEQGMFSDPMQLPQGANALHMLWTYVLKTCGTKKARMVCNGHPRQKGTVTIGHTYANSLDAASERLFWAIAAQEGLLVIGADVSNAFAEAPPPQAPLYLYIDEAYRDWWLQHLSRPPIPKEYTVVRVHNAIQGHPEAPRLWEKHIDQILKSEGMKPTTHEPCLYIGTTGPQLIIFLRQVDDFAIGARQSEHAEQLLARINAKMRIDIKIQGLITRFNGMDIHQTQDYVKITCEKYLHKMIQHHQWLQLLPTPSAPIPLPADPTYIQNLEKAQTPVTETQQKQLQQQMGFSYRQVIGELLYPMVKCRPDIAFHTTKLSQYMANPASEHYQALIHLCQYVAATINNGIYYWRRNPRNDLPYQPHPELHHDNYTLDIDPAELPGHLYGYVDADWGTDTAHRKSVTGIVMMYSGGAIGYKCKIPRYNSTLKHGGRIHSCM